MPEISWQASARVYQGYVLKDLTTQIFIHELSVFIYVFIYNIVPQAVSSDTR